MPKSYKKKKLEYFDISVYVCFIDTFRYEPRHDKTDKTSVHPAKTQISLGWYESSLGAHSLCWFCHDVAHIMSTDVLIFVSIIIFFIFPMLTS